MEITLKEVEHQYKVTNNEEVASISVTSVDNEIESIYLYDHYNEIVCYASGDTCKALIEIIRKLV